MISTHLQTILSISIIQTPTLLSLTPHNVLDRAPKYPQYIGDQGSLPVAFPATVPVIPATHTLVKVWDPLIQVTVYE